MAIKKFNWRGKHGGNHQTLIDAAKPLLAKVITDDVIAKISPGFIKGGKSSSGRKSVKIIDDVGSILLSIRGSSSHQEVRIFSKDIPKARVVITQAAEDTGFHVSYGIKIGTKV